MKFRKKTKFMAVIFCMAAILLSVGGFSVGVYAASPTGSYIGQDAAKAAALTHAGVRESDTRYCNSWLEYKKGVPVYYEVKFVAGDTEYKYEIDLYSGAVLKYDTEYRNYSYIQSAGSSGTDIGQDAAKVAALTHAGVQESAASYCNSFLKYKKRIPVYYEVKFVVGNIGYEYEIDMYNATVIKCDTEYRDYTYSQPAGGNTNPGNGADIGQAAAKQVAFSHAGLSEANVYHLKVKQDYDHGRLEYEVEFKYNGMEYEYDIDAATGNIIKYECDYD